MAVNTHRGDHDLHTLREAHAAGETWHLTPTGVETPRSWPRRRPLFPLPARGLTLVGFCPRGPFSGLALGPGNPRVAALAVGALCLTSRWVSSQLMSSYLGPSILTSLSQPSPFPTWPVNVQDSVCHPSPWAQEKESRIMERKGLHLDFTDNETEVQKKRKVLVPRPSRIQNRNSRGSQS